MDRIEAISKCRYYSGETECPFSTDNCKMYWEMERAYADHNGRLDELQDDYYNALGGKSYKGIPKALLIVMFTLWGKGVWDMKKSLPDFYQLVDDYLQTASDHFPVDTIPHNIE